MNKKVLGIFSRFYLGSNDNNSLILFVAGTVILYTGLSDVCLASTGGSPRGGGGGLNPLSPSGNPLEFDPIEIEKAWCALYALSEGAWGGLITTAAGLGVIVSSVVGKYQSAFSLLVVAVSAFALRSFVSLYFGTLPGCYPGGPLSPFPASP